MAMETKLCIGCSVAKPWRSFSRDATRKDLLYPYCKECCAAKYAANPKPTVTERGVAKHGAYKPPGLSNSAALAYFSGVFDGEGTLFMRHFDKPPNRPDGQYTNYTTAYMRVANTNIALIRWLYANFGGSFSGSSSGPHLKIQYQWSLSHGQAAILLQAILPLLIVKASEASNFLEMCRLLGRKSQGRGKYLSEEDKAARAEVYRQYRNLKHSIRLGEGNR